MVWGRFVCWSWVVGSRFSWVVFWVLGNTFVLNVSNIARVSIGNAIGNNLGATIRKSNTVFAMGGVAITGLIGSKVSL